MTEFLRHVFGLCGEGHVNIWTLLVSGFALVNFIVYKLLQYAGKI
jgi:hypothetical protein